MSNFLKDISFKYSTMGLPFGGSFSCDMEKGSTTLICFSSEDVMSSSGTFTWSISLDKEEEQALAAALWAIIDQAPFATETAIVVDGSIDSIRLKYKNNKIKHHWNSFSDHEVITQFSKLVSSLGHKPHTKRKLRMPPELEV